jgi:transcriptional regulator GlxA family with amidase domain
MSYDLHGVFHMVQRNLQKEPLISLAKMSRQLAIERHTIERAVRSEIGRSFRSLRREIAFEQARDKLRSLPNQSIKEISFALGYNSPRTFSRFIRGVCGKPPNELREGSRLREPRQSD